MSSLYNELKALFGGNVYEVATEDADVREIAVVGVKNTFRELSGKNLLAYVCHMRDKTWRVNYMAREPNNNGLICVAIEYQSLADVITGLQKMR